MSPTNATPHTNQGLVPEQVRIESWNALEIKKNDNVSYFFEQEPWADYYDYLFLFFVMITTILAARIAIKKTKDKIFIFALTAVISILFYCLSLWVKANPTAIINESVVVRGGPGETYLDRAVLDRGTVVRVSSNKTTSSSNWAMIRYKKDGSYGYVPMKSLLLFNNESNKPKDI